jgi:hypothetical protein
VQSELAVDACILSFAWGGETGKGQEQKRVEAISLCSDGRGMLHPGALLCIAVSSCSL